MQQRQTLNINEPMYQSRVLNTRKFYARTSDVKHYEILCNVSR